MSAPSHHPLPFEAVVHHVQTHRKEETVVCLLRSVTAVKRFYAARVIGSSRAEEALQMWFARCVLCVVTHARDKPIAGTSFLHLVLQSRALGFVEAAKGLLSHWFDPCIQWEGVQTLVALPTFGADVASNRGEAAKRAGHAFRKVV